MFRSKMASHRNQGWQAARPTANPAAPAQGHSLAAARSALATLAVQPTNATPTLNGSGLAPSSSSTLPSVSSPANRYAASPSVSTSAPGGSSANRYAASPSVSSSAPGGSSANRYSAVPSVSSSAPGGSSAIQYSAVPSVSSSAPSWASGEDLEESGSSGAGPESHYTTESPSLGFRPEPFSSATFTARNAPRRFDFGGTVRNYQNRSSRSRDSNNNNNNNNNNDLTYMTPTVAPGSGKEEVSELPLLQAFHSAQASPHYESPTFPKHNVGKEEVEAPGLQWFDAATEQQGPAPALHGTYATKNVPGCYDGEQVKATFRGSPGQWERHAKLQPDQFLDSVATQYWNQTKRKAHEVTFDSGKLKYRDKPMDTSDNDGVGMQTILLADEDGAMKRTNVAGNYLYAMQGDGKFVGSSGWGDRQMFDTGATKEGKRAQHLRMVNHSTLVGGGAVAGAGEMKVRNGVLEQISDASGHYTPSGKMTVQVLQELQRMRVDLGAVETKLVRNGGHGPQLHVSPYEVLKTQGELDRANDPTDLRHVLTRRKLAFQRQLYQQKTKLKPTKGPSGG